MEPDVSLDRLENPGTCLLLRAGLAAHFLAATRTGAERRTTQHQPHAGRIRLHPRDSGCLPSPSKPTAGPHRHLPHPDVRLAATPLLPPQPSTIRPCNPLGHTRPLPAKCSPGPACPETPLISCKLPLDA